MSQAPSPEIRPTVEQAEIIAEAIGRFLRTTGPDQPPGFSGATSAQLWAMHHQAMILVDFLEVLRAMFPGDEPDKFSITQRLSGNSRFP